MNELKFALKDLEETTNRLSAAGTIMLWEGLAEEWANMSLDYVLRNLMRLDRIRRGEQL